MAMQHDAWVDLLLVRSPSRAGDVATQRPARGHYVWTAWPRGARQPRDCRLTFTLGASMTALSRLRSWRHAAPAPRTFVRSEEHTSELQSLMRISYAVFCLKKKKTYTK